MISSSWLGHVRTPAKSKERAKLRSAGGLAVFQDFHVGPSAQLFSPKTLM
jgi:hypothetical protein